MGESQAVEGPDLTAGVPVEALDDGHPFAGRVGDEAVMLVRRGEEVLAISATCTHYGGPLSEGLVVGETVMCPWHHACFSLRTGEAIRAPALNPVACWRVEVEGGKAYVRGKEEADPLSVRGREAAAAPESVVIVGAGAAGSAAAEMLRREGYTGRVTLVDPEESAPYDRPNLSKDYLAGNAPEEWIPLRPQGFYGEHGIERVVARVLALDPHAKTVALSDGRSLPYGALLLATGATPVRLPVPGADQPHVHVLRSLDDCRAIIAAAENAQRVVVLGASFIGMEVAGSLRARDREVTVVAPEAVPFEHTLGRELGSFLRDLHREHGVDFRLGRKAASVEPGRVRLDDGSELPADLVVVGIGVRPDTELAEQAGLEVDDGLLVDEYLRTSAPDVYAAGDIARWPDARSGERIRVEHWVLAQRQGQVAARNLLGKREAFREAPFFWTQHYDVPIAYVGHAKKWSEARVDGDIAARDCRVSYIRDGRPLAVATIYRDEESMKAQVEMDAVAVPQAGGRT